MPIDYIGYYRIVDYHHEILGHDRPVNCFELMWIMGTELDHLTDGVDKKYLTHLSMENFNFNKPGFVTKEEREQYPWDKLAESIKTDGLKRPVLAVRTKAGRYYAIEGKHRLRAVSLIKPFSKTRKFPCLVIERDEEYTKRMYLKNHPCPQASGGYKRFETK